jgi:hypothetical protein
MAIIDRASLALVLTALLSSSVSGQSNINWRACGIDEDTRAADDGAAAPFAVNRDGTERRTCK